MQLLFLFVSFFRNILSRKTVGGPVRWSAAIPQIPSRWSQLATSGSTTTLSTATKVGVTSGLAKTWDPIASAIFTLQSLWLDELETKCIFTSGSINLKKTQASKTPLRKLRLWNNFQDRIHWVFPTSSTPHHWLNAWRRRSRQAVALDFLSGA